MTSPLSQQGNSKAYTLSRLEREAPELHQAVCAGEMSANAAAIQAGLRKKPSPLEMAKKLVPKLTDDEWQLLCELREQAKQDQQIHKSMLRR